MLLWVFCLWYASVAYSRMKKGAEGYRRISLVQLDEISNILMILDENENINKSTLEKLKINQLEHDNEKEKLAYEYRIK